MSAHAPSRKLEGKTGYPPTLIRIEASAGDVAGTPTSKMIDEMTEVRHFW